MSKIANSVLADRNLTAGDRYSNNINLADELNKIKAQQEADFDSWVARMEQAVDDGYWDYLFDENESCKF